MSHSWRIAAALLAAVSLTGCPRLQKRADQSILTLKPRPKVHYVKAGDTLTSISRRYGVPVDKILEHNRSRIPSPSQLRPHMVLLIPLHERTEPPQLEPDPKPQEPQTGLVVPPALVIRKVSRHSLHRGKPSHALWWPTDGALVRKYGEGVRGFWEAGIGLAAPAGTEVCAVADGKVICCVEAGHSPKPGWGNVVSISHSDGIVSWYGCLERMLVKEGQRVKKGERVGTVGASGAATKPELAFRLFDNERPVDPSHYLP